MSKTYCWVYYEIKDGDTSYGEYEPVEINGEFKVDEKLEKLLAFKLIGENEFGMENEDCENCYDENEQTIEESGGYRIGEVGTIKIIPKSDYEVLKKYNGFTVIDVPSAFQFR